MANTFEQEVYRNRTRDFEFKIYEADGTTGVAIQTTDVVRCKLGRLGGGTPDLDLRSGAATANGSTVTITQTTAPATGLVRMAQGDTNLLPVGAYRAELMLVDDSETAPADAVKVFSTGVIHVIDQLGGGVGLV